MALKSFTFLSVPGVLAMLVMASGCATDNPAAPMTSTSTPSAGPVSSGSVSATPSTSSGVALSSDGPQIKNVSFTTPQPLQPANNAQIKNLSQPVTLVVTNAVTTGSSPAYTFEVATDSGFSNIVASKTGVAPGPGQTSVTLGTLPPSQTYYWRARLVSTGGNGPNSRISSFVIGPPVTLSTPVLASPGANATVGGQPALTVNNVQVTGPAGTIYYRFDVADSSSFGNIVFTSTVPQQTGASTTVSVTATLNPGTNYWWRVQASDPTDGITTPYSVANPFQIQTFNWNTAIVVNSPYDLASWAQTSNITSVVFTPFSFEVDFDARDGPNRWVDTPFGDGTLEYTLGMCVNPGGQGQWYCSAVVQFWYGRDLDASGVPSQVGQSWFYDVRWGPMQGYQPQDGEIVGLFTMEGNGRNDVAGDMSYVKERTNVALVPWSNEGGTSYTFSGGRLATAVSKVAPKVTAPTVRPVPTAPKKP